MLVQLFLSSGHAAPLVVSILTCKDAVPPQESFELSCDKIEDYNGDSAFKEMLSTLLGS